MNLRKNTLLFVLGGGGYVGLELLYRGRSHYSMFLAGGVCFLLLGRLRRTALPAAVRACLGAGAITAVELATGLLVNRDYQVWDYRQQPGNFLGQICPRFTLLWIPLAWAGMELFRLAEQRGKEASVGQREDPAEGTP